MKSGTQRADDAGKAPAARSAHRADIDGLRALAVVPVVLYHAGVPGLSGGFAGVDVFFVISGYLIGGIIRREIDAGCFSVARFYERRARRILPALSAVVFATLVAARLVLPAPDFADVSASAAGAMLFASNVWFLFAIDYFTRAAEFLPLLHTWSLAVEEQFYLIAPLGLLLLHARAPKRTLAIVGFLALASLLCSVVMLESHPAATFYLLPTRAWELGAGVLLAYGLVPALKGPSRAPAIIGVLGMCLLGLGIAVLDAATPFPGVAAVPVVLGAAMIIWAGEHPGTPVAQLLGCRPLVAIGLVSYSWYLWHWPILALARAWRDEVDLPLAVAATAVVGSLLLAAASWRFVEQPFRRSGPARTGPWPALGASAAIILLIWGVAFAGHRTAGSDDPSPLRTAGQARDVPSAPCRDTYVDFAQCRLSLHFDEAGEPGEVVGRTSGSTPSILLWGDSHARALAPGLAALLAGAGADAAFAFRSGCPPTIGVERIDGQAVVDCARFNAEVLSAVARAPEIGTVVLHARWALFTTGRRAPGEPGVDPVLERVQDSAAAEAVSTPALFEAGIRALVHRLRELDRRVVILTGIPEIGWHVPTRLDRASRFGIPPPPAPDRQMIAQRNRRASELFASLAMDPGVRIVETADRLCDPRCRVAFDGRPAYLDDDHLAGATARWLIGSLPELAAALAVP